MGREGMDNPYTDRSEYFWEQRTNQLMKINF